MRSQQASTVDNIHHEHTSSSLSIILSDREDDSDTDSVPNLRDGSFSPACSCSTASVLSSSSNYIMSNCPVVNCPANMAWVEQDSPSKVPVLHPGVILPAVMREF
jgi:hypothetical protein